MRHETRRACGVPSDAVEGVLDDVPRVRGTVGTSARESRTASGAGRRRRTRLEERLVVGQEQARDLFFRSD